MVIPEVVSPVQPAAQPAPEPRRGDGDARVGVVVITRDRREEVLAALDRLRGLPERPAVVVVDNASNDGTSQEVRVRHPWVQLVTSAENLGAVGRNVGTRLLDTPYVAFGDDDMWWEPGAMATAADALDAHPALAVVAGRTLVEPDGREDPINAELATSPIQGPSWLPGPALSGFLAGGSVVRRTAFSAVGGFSERLWIGGEEQLLAADLSVAGWEMCYLPQVLVHHQPSRRRDPSSRRRLGLRNSLWFLWLRRPLVPAVRRSVHLLRVVPRDRVSALAVIDAVAGLPWVVRERRRLPQHVEARYLALDRPQEDSAPRRYAS